ncbi:MAG TPA: SDR family NAD(P)-dependent oxidoreductase [Meiothermus sp.]|nr:SDR family NAD(P)-dependent oxidoreductase [Meiothermus sp.]
MRAVLVTGASTGIGLECALHLSRQGFKVFAGVRRETDANHLKTQASYLTPLLLDVTDLASIQKSAQVVAEAVGQAGLWGLVNNAGIAVAGPLEFLPLEELRRQYEVNVIGQVAVTQAFLPLLRKARGRIVMMSSISGRVASPMMGPYASSKFALEALSDSLRRELMGWGLEVAVIEPGNIQTPIWGKGVSWGKRLLEQLPPRAKELYGTGMDQILRYIEGMDAKGLPPLEVAKVVEHALTAPRPRTRYVVGRGAKLAAFLSRVLPDRLMDRVAFGRFQKRPRGL